MLARARDPDTLVAAGVRWTTKIVLFPARFVYTADTGREGTNEAAVQPARPLTCVRRAAPVQRWSGWKRCACLLFLN